jgi:hypothetical protein
VTDTGRETVSSSFYPTYTFDAVAISVTFVVELESMSTTGSFQWSGVIDEKHRVVSIVFLTQFGKENLCESVAVERTDSH